MTTLTPEILTMPLTELRERVELAERLALASRLTPGTQYAGNVAAVQPKNDEPVKQPDTAPAPAAEAPKATRTRTTRAATTPAPETAPATTTAGPTADELMAAMDGTPETAPASDELTLDDVDASEDDMLEGFELEAPAENLREKLNELAAAKTADMKAKGDKVRLGAARGLLEKYKVARISELPDDQVKAFYEEFLPI